MAFNSEKIERIVKAKGIKAKDFFAYVYPGRSGSAYFGSIASNNNPKADAIERIADLLECPIDELFDRQPATPDEPVSTNANESPEDGVLIETVRHLNNIISQQNETIADQSRHIDQLLQIIAKSQELNTK